ncbi:MAG: SCP2 sterol-binding domain-containing protein [Candidatus Accumulibacter sp.]|jgi:predicted lipid carrier protein YhbT|nr:SCP2 sterol-binding domain-containing protein [Accumulibacter sp.]
MSMTEGFHRFFSIPGFTLPPLIARVGARLPQWPHAVALAACFNAVLGMRLLPEDDLALLEKRRFLIDILDTGVRIALGFRDGRFHPLFSVPETPDLVFRANLSAFLRIAARQEDPDTLFFNRALDIEGDTELGLIVKNMLDAVEWPKCSGMAIFRH